MAENSRSGRFTVDLHADVAGSISLVQQNQPITRRRLPRPFRRLGGVIALLLLTGGGLAWWQPWESSSEPASREPRELARPDKPSSAVLPVANMSNNADQAYFSDGATEDLTSAPGADVDAGDAGLWSSWTDLHRAVHAGDTDVAALLIANGADVDATTAAFVHTPLFLAIRRGHRAMVELLIGNGANVNATDARANTPLHYAAIQGDLGIVQLLLANGAVVYATTLSGDYPGETPLHTSAFAGHVEIAELLLAHGADVNATDRYNYTPLRRTLDQGHMALAELLIRNGADIATTDRSGVTLLHVVARKGHVAIAELLITGGLDLNAMDSSGFTPLDYAQGGEARMVEVLERHGAICTICQESGK